MLARRRLGIEPLELRNMFSGATSLTHWVASELGQTTQAPPAVVGSLEAGSTPQVDAMPLMAPSVLASDASRWDWLGGTQWYVPSENLLSYLVPADLSDPKPLADQTVWTIVSCKNGVIAGESVTTFDDRTDSTRNFDGIVTDSGQVRINFYGGNETTTGVGQMRLVDSQWRVEMQMATGSSEIITHWAYMTQVPDGPFTPPPPDDPPPPGSLRADNWKWIEGTNWAITDKNLFGTGALAGVFNIESFRNGYFWGSGTSKEPFNVMGSVTPEGNVLLMISVSGGTPESRMGLMEQTSDQSGIMQLRTYLGEPSIGQAWTLVPSMRLIMASVQGVIQEYGQTS